MRLFVKIQSFAVCRLTIINPFAMNSFMLDGYFCKKPNTMRQSLNVLFAVLLMVDVSILASTPDVTVLHVINDEDNTAVAYAGILNYSQRLSIITDSSGMAHLDVYSGDTLVLQCMGYFMHKYIVPEDGLVDTLSIELPIRKYEIAEVRYLHFRNYTDFKKAVLELEMPETELDRLQANLNISSRIAAAEGDEIFRQNQKASGGFGVGVGIPSKDDIDRARLRAVKEKEARWEVIARKYNRSIVQEITQFDGDALTDFMLFCDFKEEFLLNASRAEIAMQIMQKLNVYQQKSDGSWCGDNEAQTGIFPVA